MKSTNKITSGVKTRPLKVGVLDFEIRSAHTKSANDGFIALMSSIIISAVLIAMVFTLSFSEFTSRFNLLDSSYKEASKALAESCADEALLKLENDITYAGNETITVASSTCAIRPIAPSTPRIVQTTATSTNAVTNIQVTVDPTNLSVLSWEEVPNF